MSDIPQETTTPMAERIPKKGPPQHPALAGNIQRIIAEQGTTATAVSKKAGLGLTTVADIIAGRTVNPSLRILRAIAAALGEDIRSLLDPPTGSTAIPPSRHRENIKPLTLNVPFDILRKIPVVAIAAAGVWREYPPMGINETDARIGPAVRQDFPLDQYFTVKVDDFGMDIAKPYPLIPGSEVYCIDLVAAKLIVETGKIYAIRQWRDVGDRRQSEVIIRRAYVFADRTELRAESSRHHDERCKTITTETPTLSTDPQDSIHAFGLVMYVLGACYMS